MPGVQAARINGYAAEAPQGCAKANNAVRERTSPTAYQLFSGPEGYRINVADRSATTSPVAISRAAAVADRGGIVSVAPKHMPIERRFKESDAPLLPQSSRRSLRKAVSGTRSTAEIYFLS